MILDKLLQFADALAITATGASTNQVPMSVAKNRLGSGEPMVVLITLDVAADFTTGDETYVFTLRTDATSAMSSPTTVSTVTVPGGSAVGSKFILDVPPTGTTEEILEVLATLGGTTPSVTYSAHLIPRSFIQDDAVYPDNITIS